MKSPTETPNELANTLTHGLGFLLTLVGVPGLVVMACRGDAWHIVSCSVYGATLFVLYAASTIYHFVRHPRRKRLFRIADHACIYLLIAGTYTPFTLVTLRGGWGWTLFGLVWGGAVVGISFKVFWTGRFEVVSTIVYVLMGWAALIAVRPILEALPVGGIVWLVAGGLCYTGGIVFYAQDRKPYMHALWHLCVLAGSVCHYVTVMRWVLPTDLWT